MTTTTTDEPQVWIGCIGCYNAGRLAGDWYDAKDCPTDMRDFKPRGVFLGWNHYAEQHEELWVMDHENFGGLLNRECSPFEALRLTQLIVAADERGISREVLAYWVADGNGTDDADEFLDGLQDAYAGRWDSGAAYAQDLHDEMSNQADTSVWPYSCIDWTHAFRELEYGGDAYSTEASDGGVHIFRAT
jgi:hypothetical protein